MTDLRKPAFLQHAPSTSRPSAPSAPRLVPWMAAPLDPGLTPPTSAPRPPPPTPAPARVTGDSPTLNPVFEALPMAPAPAPTPPPTPAPSAPVVIDHTPRLQAGLDALKQEARRLGEQARSDALEIGVLIARRVLERELTTSLDPLFGLIRSAIRRVGEAREIVVKVSADDHRRLQDSPGTSLALANVTLQIDEALGPGDVVVESDQHGVDGRIDTRLEELRRELREAMQAE
ncbi:MAG: hypothetical protein IAE78_21350 [Myxococcus sp.]|nr:hypothetical protein [Myxococcus sp.]